MASRMPCIGEPRRVSSDSEIAAGAGRIGNADSTVPPEEKLTEMLTSDRLLQ